VKTQLHAEFIDPNALDIISTLQRNGFTTYLVGGCVRDLLLNIKPKDFDIVTMATPQQVQKVIRPSFIIGKRFRLVLVRRYGQQFEISTFRALNYQTEGAEPEEIDENIYGEPKEDALRRDFTVNGLFYDPSNQEIIDYTEGMKDIEKRVVRMIGDPKERIEQDPIRILRALRFAHKTHFTIERSLREAIHAESHLLQKAILPRVREEILKILRLNEPGLALWEALDLQILQYVLPSLETLFHDEKKALLFTQLLQKGMDFVDAAQDSYALYTIFMYSYLSANNPDWQNTLTTRLDDKINEFMKTELGMHRIETEIFTQSITLLKQLMKNHDPVKLRARHRDHMLTNRALPLALLVAEAYHYLTTYEVHQWRVLLLSSARQSKR
jgi:poly(A) polymerase